MYKFLRSLSVQSIDLTCSLMKSSSVSSQHQPQRRRSHMVELPPRSGFKLALLHWISRMRTRYCMWKLRQLMPPDFNESDFMLGARHAATTIIKAVQKADWNSIHGCCTDRGACEIYGLTQSQQGDYSKLLRFECQHLWQVLPIAVQRQCMDGRTFVYVRLSFVGLRDMRDFATCHEHEEMLKMTRQMLQESRIPEQMSPFQQRLIVGEFLLTLAIELGLETHDWLVDYYKVFGFKLVNYSPVTLKYRIIELQKPV